MNKFEELKQSWFKRRTPTETIPQLIEFNVTDFTKEADTKCILDVKYDNDESFTLTGTVHPSKTFTIGGGETIHYWYVTGTLPSGLSVQLKLID